MVDSSRTGIELKTTQQSVSRPITTGGKGARRNQHKQLDEPHSAEIMVKNVSNAHAQQYKLTSEDDDQGRRRLVILTKLTGTGTTRLSKTLNHE